MNVLASSHHNKRFSVTCLWAWCSSDFTWRSHDPHCCLCDIKHLLILITEHTDTEHRVSKKKWDHRISTVSWLVHPQHHTVDWIQQKKNYGKWRSSPQTCSSFRFLDVLILFLSELNIWDFTSHWTRTRTHSVHFPNRPLEGEHEHDVGGLTGPVSNSRLSKLELLSWGGQRSEGLETWSQNQHHVCFLAL